MERYTNPVPPERTDNMAESMVYHPEGKLASLAGLAGVRRGTGSTHQFASSTVKGAKEYTNREMKNLADRLGFTLNSKVNNSFDMFKFFDKDNDG